MEKEGKILHEQNRTKRYTTLAIASTLLGFIGYNVLSGLGIVPKLSVEPTAIVQKKKNTAATTTKKKRWMPAESLPELELIVEELDQEVRAIKKSGVIMETDPKSIQKTAQLQKATLNLLKAKYGDHDNYRVRLDIQFPGHEKEQIHPY